MRSVVIVSMYYWPEPTGIAPMATELAEYLASRDFHVEVLTGMPMMPEWEVYQPYRKAWRATECRNGVTIRRSRFYVPNRPQSGRMKAWKRVLCDTSFALGAALRSLIESRATVANVVVVIGPPLQAGLLMKMVNRETTGTVYWVQDIVPDAALNVGLMQPGFLLRVARRLESAVYGAADVIGVISAAFRENLAAKGVPKGKLVVLPNWADVQRFDETPADHSKRAALGFSDSDFVIMHAGSVAAKQKLENVLEAMYLLRNSGTIKMVFVGSGNAIEGIRAVAARLKLTNVSFLPTKTGTDFVNTLRAADALLVNQAKDVVDVLLPSKLLTYWLSGKPIVAAVNSVSETARVIEESQSGIVVEPEDPQKLSAAIRRLESAPDERLAMSLAADRFVRARFDKRKLLPEMENVLIDLITPRERCGGCEQRRT